MLIPKDWFCVVKRSTKDTRSRGEIVKHGLTKELATYLSNKYKEIDKENNYWVIDYREY